MATLALSSSAAFAADTVGGLPLRDVPVGSVTVSHAPPPPAAEGFTPVRTMGETMEYRLDANGLNVLLLPQKLAPVTTFMVTYHVGSRNEVTGTTGATHLLEHMMFKGTAIHDRSLGTSYDQILERFGAETNATTWLDRTNYFASVPSNALPQLIAVEADRMRNLSLREEDRRPEMTVVRNEFERGENSPTEALEKEIWAAAFQAHPYHHPTIGWRSDFERVPIAKLRAFYDTFYWPDNATVTVIGDFDPAQTLATIKQSYGVIPKSPHPFPQLYTEEPEQTGQRRVLVQRSGELGVVGLAHKIPGATHSDLPAIEVFSAILTNGRTSRCYRALTDKNLTIDVSGDVGFNRDPSLHILWAELNEGVKHEDVELKLEAEIEKVKNGGVTSGEVQSAVAGLLAKHAFLRDGTFEQASEVNECIAVGDWTLFVTMADKLKAVTPEDVQSVAKKYFIDRHSVVGWFVPAPGPEDESDADHWQTKNEHFEPKNVAAPRPPEKELAPTPSADLAKRVTREKIAGIDVLVCPTAVKGIVSLLGSLPAGEAASPNRALALLTSDMLERGTKKHDQFALADLLEKVGATMEYKVKNDTVEFSVRCLTKDVPLVLSVIAEEMRQPAFAAEEFAKLKKELASEVQQSQEDPGKLAAIAFSRAVFPMGHPSRLDTVEELIQQIGKAKLAEVRAFHAANYGPTGMHLIAVGDISVDLFKSEVAKNFEGWKPQPKKSAPPADTSAFKESEVVVPMQDKASVSVAIGQPSSVRESDADWLPLTVGTDVLGSGFISRLMGNVRDREGLTYGIGAKMDEDSYRPGVWFVQATFAPSLLEKGLASTRREIDKWWKDGITADELAYRKSSIAGKFLIGMETTNGLAGELLDCVECGFDVSWLDEFPGRVDALTVDQVNNAIKKHLDPSKMATVKAGTLK
jgi:zinc protease